MHSNKLCCSRMKVTVCFGDVRVVVPCGNGDMVVRELMDDAVLRYKKAIGLSSSSKVSVRHLMLGVGGGILDEEDRVADVVEDKDQIIADFKNIQPDIASQSLPVANPKDNAKSLCGTAVAKPNDVLKSKSASEVVQPLSKKDATNQPGTDFNSNLLMNASPKNGDIMTSSIESVVKNRTGPAENSTSLTNSMTNVAGQHQLNYNQIHHLYNQTPVLKKILRKSKEEAVKKTDPGQGISRKDSPERQSDFLVTSPEVYSSFIRDSSRKSLSNQLVMAKWLDAQERTLDNEQLRLHQQKQEDNFPSPSDSPEGRERTHPLSPTGSVCGTGSSQFRSRNIDNVEKNVNGWRYSFYGPTSSSSAHAVSVPQYQSLTSRKKRRAPEPPVQEVTNRPLVPPSPISKPHSTPSCDTITVKESSKKVMSLPSILGNGDSETSNELLSTAGTAATNVINTPGSGKSSADQKSASKLMPSKKGVLAPTNTRLIGRKIAIQLKKGSNGLGFSITTRDNIAGCDCPIYIKNILPVGAAVEDGRLTAGDRLLEVNGMEMTGKTQTEAAQILRGIPVNSVVDILVSRQVMSDDELVCSDLTNPDGNTLVIETNVTETTSTADDSTSVRKDLASKFSAADANVTSKNINASAQPEDERSLLTFEIPPSSSSSFSFNQARHGGQDCGIFVKKPTLKDGPFLVNDQLIAVNGVSLCGLSNSKAVEIVREALKHQPDNGFIRITVSRPKAIDSPFFTSFVSDKERYGSGTEKSCVLQEAAVAENPHSDHVHGKEKASDDFDKSSQVVKGNDIQISSESVGNKQTTDNAVQGIENGNRITGELEILNRTAEGHVADGVNEEFIPDDSLDRIDLIPGFNREGFGRQSISEKRKGHADPSNFDVYQKIKQGKEDRMNYNSASWDPRKSALYKNAVSAKKCKSLEDLHVIGQQLDQLTVQDELPNGRKNNPSFLVAVDRSYDLSLRNLEDSAGRGPVSNSRESFLTLGKMPLFPGLARADKKKSDMDKIRSIIKKGTDMFRFSKRRRSADTKDIKNRRNLNTRSVFWVEETTEQDNLSHQTRLGATPADMEPPQGDSSLVHSSGNGDVEVTHFGAECVTTVMKDGSDWIQRKLPADRELRQGIPVKPTTGKLQQLRAEYQRHHRERQGQYPLDIVQDQYEKQLQDHERFWTTSQQSVASAYGQQFPSSQRSGERSSRLPNRPRPHPICGDPDVPAELDYLEYNSKSSSGYLTHDSQLSCSSGLQNSCYQYTSDPYVYLTPPTAGEDLSSMRSAESKDSYFRQSRLSDYNNACLAGAVVLTSLQEQDLARCCVHDRQQSSPFPASPSLPVALPGDRRHSFSEQLPMTSTCHQEMTYGDYPSSRLQRFEGIMSQSSHV